MGSKGNGELFGARSALPPLRDHKETVGFLNLGDSLGGDFVVNNVDRIFGHDNEIIAGLEYLLNRTGVLFVTLHQQFLVVLSDTDESLLLDRCGPIIKHYGLVFGDGKLGDIL